MNHPAKIINTHKLVQLIKPTQTITLLVGILVLVIIGVFHTLTPKKSPVEAAPLTSFSATRAMPYVRQIGTKPHPTGSLENTKVRQYLVEQLQRLGFHPEIQSTLAVIPQKQKIGKIHNVLVRIPGKEPAGKALLLAAHYDSVPTGAGAADDGASVAAILETLRAIKNQPALQSDVICVFTDGEEAGLLGAEAFIREHPWAKNIGLALNFEYRGNRGAFMMFETSQGNGKLIEGLAIAAPSLWATSWMYEAYKHLPNGSDLTIFKQAGIPGMNFAAIEGHTSYHTQLDNPELLNQNTLQQEGDTMLALVKHFGNISLNDLQSKDRVYFDVPGLGLVNYPANWVMPFSGIVTLLFVTVIILALITKTVRIIPLLSGTIAFVFILFGLALANHYLWLGIRRYQPEYQTFMQGDTYNSHWYLLTFVFLTIGSFLFLYLHIRKRLHPLEFTFGAMAGWLMLLMMSSVWVPGASFLFFWPLMAMLIVVGLLLVQQKENAQQPINVLLIFLGSIPGILLFAPLIRGLFIGLTPQMTGVVMFFLILLLGLLSPLLEILGQRKYFVRSTLLLGFIFLITGSLTSGFDADHPRQNTLFYVLDASNQQGTTQSAYWLSTDKQLDEWTSTFFSGVNTKQPMPALFGNRSPGLWVAPAPLLASPAPKIALIEDGALFDKRKIKLRIKSLRRAPKLKISIEGVDVLESKVAGQDYTQTPQHYWSVDSYGLNDEELMIEFTVNAGIPFMVRVIDFSYGLPALTQSREMSMISKPTEFSDTMAVVSATKFR